MLVRINKESKKKNLILLKLKNKWENWKLLIYDEIFFELRVLFV